MVAHSDGEPAVRLQKGWKVPETAGEIAEIRLRGQTVRAVRVFEKVLRVGEAGGLTAEEFERDQKLWVFKLSAAEKLLRLVVRRAPAGNSKVKSKGATGDAEDEPEDDSGVPADFLSHLQ